MSFCNVCGTPITEESYYRPKMYCSSNCRNYMKYKNALEKVLISLELTDDARKVIKGDMFRLSNLLGNGTKVTWGSLMEDINSLKGKDS